MRVAHLSDLHLGFRAFPRQERGWNLRERDLAGAFHQALLEAARLRPDLIILSGDLFHSADPPSTAFLTLTRGISTLRGHLPLVPILAIAGARDTPAAPADPGPVAVLDALPGVEAASGTPRAVQMRELDAHALLIPHRAALRPPFPEIRPNPDARWNVLVVRGEPEEEGEGLRVDAAGWDYIAVGGTHRMTRFQPRVWAAGSLERAGWDPWRESTEEKGFLMADLGTGEVEFHPVPGRPVVDLAPVRTARDDLEGGSRRLRDLVDGIPGGVDGKILRVRLRGDLLSATDGVAAGLLAAIRKKTAHAELRLSAVGDRPGPGPSPGEPTGDESTPLTLSGGGVDGLPVYPGVTLITAGTEEARVRAGAALLLAPETTGAEVGRVLKLSPALDPGSTGAILAGGWLEPGAALTEGAGILFELDDHSGESPSSANGDSGEEPAGVELQLQEARADSVEAAGDVEARAMEWARERQDAESHLVAYRDRARELRARIQELETQGEEAPCPTCGRPIGDHLPSLAQTLREEWEDVVQDGKWWKRRREQLDEKPEDLREMEKRALSLRARTQALSREVDRLRDRIAPPEDPDSLPLPALDSRRLMVERGILRKTGNFLYQVTEGRITGVRRGPGALEVEEGFLAWRRPLGSEVPLLAWALHFAILERAWERGVPLRGAVFRQLAMSGLFGECCRAVELMATSPIAHLPMLLVTSPEVAGATAEWAKGVVESEEDPEGRPRLRWVPGGLPRLRLVEAE